MKKTFVGKLNDAPVGSHVTMFYMKQDLLGVVRDHIHPRTPKNYSRLGVHFLNGEAWPIEPLVGLDQVYVLTRTFNDEKE